MKPCVFIHTNHKQYLGALVSMHSMRRNSRHADEFDVKLIEYETYQDFFAKYEGRTYSRDGDSRTWDKEDLQSFTPLRFMPPELMGYQGRAVVVGPRCVRRPRRLGAALARHAGQGHHVPAAGHAATLCLERHAARLR